jgi:hypothetical protein
LGQLPNLPAFPAHTSTIQAAKFTSTVRNFARGFDVHGSPPMNGPTPGDPIDPVYFACMKSCLTERPVHS